MTNRSHSNSQLDESFGIIPIFRPPWASVDQRQRLLVQHLDGHHRWFPKGHKKGKESSIETATRELEEETWLVPHKILHTKKFREQYRFFNPEGESIKKQVSYYIWYVPQNEIIIQTKEIADAIRCTYSQADAVITHPESKKILENAYNFLKNIP